MLLSYIYIQHVGVTALGEPHTCRPEICSAGRTIVSEVNEEGWVLVTRRETCCNGDTGSDSDGLTFGYGHYFDQDP